MMYELINGRVINGVDVVDQLHYAEGFRGTIFGDATRAFNQIHYAQGFRGTIFGDALLEGVSFNQIIFGINSIKFGISVGGFIAQNNLLMNTAFGQASIFHKNESLNLSSIKSTSFGHAIATCIFFANPIFQTKLGIASIDSFATNNFFKNTEFGNAELTFIAKILPTMNGTRFGKHARINIIC